MSVRKIEIPTTLLPETQRAFKGAVDFTTLLGHAFTEVIIATGADAPIALGALFSTMHEFVRCDVPASPGMFAMKAETVRGFAQVLAAYGNAPSHDAGVDAMRAASAAFNANQMQRFDNAAAMASPRKS